MKQTIRFNLPARPLGQINPSSVSGAAFVFGYPNKRPVFGGSIQLDAIECDLVALETYASPFSATVQVDAIETVLGTLETFTSRFSADVQLDALQAVLIVVET